MKIRYNSPVILTFTIICSILFFIDRGTANSLMPYLLVGTSIDWTSPLSIITLFSHVLGHSNLDHLISNMTFVLLLGPIVEEKYGSKSMFLMIVFTAVFTGLLNISLFSTGLLGASGIVFMLILLVSFTNVKSREIPVTFILVAILFVGKEFWQSMKTDQVSQFAHIIGGFCGSVFGFIGKKKVNVNDEI